MRHAVLAGAMVAAVASVGAAQVKAPVAAPPAAALAPASARPTEPVAVVKAMYEAFEHNDMAALRDLIAPDATWTYYGPANKLPFGGVRHGPDGVLDFFAKVEETLDNPVATQRAFIAAGDMVAVPGTEESTVRSTGIRYRVGNVHLFKVQNGRIVSFEEFIDSGKVLLAFQGDHSAAVSDNQAAVSTGKAIYTTCAGCHGNDAQGRATMHAPNLTGQDPAYLVRQLTNFRGQARGKVDDPYGFAMTGRATAIPGEAGVKAVVDYIGSLPAAAEAPVSGRPVPGELSAQVAVCASCHGERGEGNPGVGGPRLNRLDSRYIAQQLHNFRIGRRGYAEGDTAGASMAAIAQQLPEDLIDPLARHYGKN